MAWCTHATYTGVQSQATEPPWGMPAAIQTVPDFSKKNPPTWLRAYRKDVSSPAYSQLLSEGAVHQPAAVWWYGPAKGTRLKRCSKLKLMAILVPLRPEKKQSVALIFTAMFTQTESTHPCAAGDQYDRSLPYSPHSTQTFLASFLLLTWIPGCPFPSAGGFYF